MAERIATRPTGEPPETFGWSRVERLGGFAHPITGGPLPKASVTRRMRAALKAAKLDHTHRFHDLRHTFGTRMAAAGVPMRTLQE